MRDRGQMAVLGAGIMGSAVALNLMRRGYRVTLFDEADGPMRGASRWNEGKIHLGFLYAADPSLRTARELVAGGLAFQNLVEELLETSIAEFATQREDLYLVHARSVVPVDAMATYFTGVSKLVSDHREAGSYFGGMAPARQLTGAAFEALEVGPEIVGAFAAPERSVDTQRVADLFEAVLGDQPTLETVFNRRVSDVSVNELNGANERWCVETGDTRHGPFVGVVNALWQGLPSLDAKVGILGDGDFSHRFRVSVFVETARAVDLQSAVICTGPFGDVKAYPGGRYYLSWYEHGLQASGGEREPPDTPVLDEARKADIATRTIRRLADVLPAVAGLSEVPSIRVEGGWVLALGDGALDDASASIHRRDRFGVLRHGRYISVNTGKYSMAPMLARAVAAVFD